MVIWCSFDSRDDFSRGPLLESLQTTITVTEGALLIFLAIQGQKIAGVAEDWTN